MPLSNESLRGPVMLGVEGLALTDGDRTRLADVRVGGVILFRRNFESSIQLRALTQEIRDARADIVIGVDHEGGRVQRFRGHQFSSIPAMRTLGEQWESDPSKASESESGFSRYSDGLRTFMRSAPGCQSR